MKLSNLPIVLGIVATYLALGFGFVFAVAPELGYAMNESSLTTLYGVALWPGYLLFELGNAVDPLIG